MEVQYALSGEVSIAYNIVGSGPDLVMVNGWGISEGVPMCLLIAATYPERVSHLVLYGGMARSTATEEYPWAPDPEGLAMNLEYVREWWATGVALEVFAPSLAEDESFLEWWRGFERNAASPGAMMQLIKMFRPGSRRGRTRRVRRLIRACGVLDPGGPLDLTALGAIVPSPSPPPVLSRIADSAPGPRAMDREPR